MPGGRVHTAINTGVGLVTTTGLLLYTYPLQDVAPYTCGIMFGNVMSPDLDMIEKGNYSMTVIGKSSWVLAELWRLFWLPYGVLSRHRGLSHVIVVGTAMRLAYLLFIPFVIWLLVGHPVLPVWPLIEFSLGVFQADVTHIILDASTSYERI